MKVKQNEDWVNVHDDNLMVSLGFRKPLRAQRDPNVWSRTPSERRILQGLRHSVKLDGFHTKPRNYMPLRDKLIIYLKKNKKFRNSTISTECWQHEIPHILAKYRVVRKDKSVDDFVIKYKWNGKVYKSTELPYWWH